MENIKKKEKKRKLPLKDEEYEKKKRIKELENLKKIGIIKASEFEKLKKDLMN